MLIKAYWSNTKIFIYNYINKCYFWKSITSDADESTFFFLRVIYYNYYIYYFVFYLSYRLNVIKPYIIRNKRLLSIIEKYGIIM